MQINFFHLIENLQPQFSAFIAVADAPRSIIPAPGDSLLTIDMGSSLEVEKLLHDLLNDPAINNTQSLSIEYQGQALEFLIKDGKSISTISKALLKRVKGKKPEEARIQINSHILIEKLTGQHATLINKTRKGAMVIPGEPVLMVDVQPISHAGCFFNELEKENPELILVNIDFRIGRITLGGHLDSLKKIANSTR